jgi:hypothetical protein
MNAYHQKGWAAIKSADGRFLSWANSNGIVVSRIEHVAVFEEWSRGAGIYIFFPTDEDLERHRSIGKLANMETLYRQYLSDAEYPSERFPVLFDFDSHENVVKNYQGSYFYRLR